MLHIKVAGFRISLKEMLCQCEVFESHLALHEGFITPFTILTFQCCNGWFIDHGEYWKWKCAHTVFIQLPDTQDTDTFKWQ